MSEAEDKIARVMKSIDESPSAQVAKKVGTLARLAYQFTSSASWVLDTLVLPAWRVARWPFLKAFRLYVRFVWNKLAKGRDGYFSPVRGGVVLVMTAAFLYFASLPILGLLWDSAMYAATSRHMETVYLTNSQEIDPENNVHSAQGCYDLPCHDSNSVYFRIRASLFNEVWSVVNGYGLFFPDYVAAAIPSAVSKCEVTSYGIRMKVFMRSTEVYPDLLESVCTPIHKSN